MPRPMTPVALPRATRRAAAARLAFAAAAAALVGCSPAAGSEQPAAGEGAPAKRVAEGKTARAARSTLVIGLDVSGSFQSRGRYESSVDFAAHYLYAHLNGLGGLNVPTAVFVGSIGGKIADEAKSFQPIHTFQGKSVEEIAAFLRRQYPSEDGLTDFNPFFERVAVLIKRQGLVLAPLNVVVLSDGVPDLRGVKADTASRYARIDVSPLEYLSRSVTVRLLYPRPPVAVRWERHVPRRRVKMWTVDDEVMAGWRKQLKPGVPPQRQDALWKWIADNVDFRVRTNVF